MPLSVLTQEFARPLATTAVQHIRKIGEGGSDARLFQCEKGRFVVKGKKQGPRVPLNELVCALLISTLGLFCATSAVVTIAETFACANQQVLSPDYGQGKYFGSEFLGKVEGEKVPTFSQEAMKELVHPEHLGGIMVFDRWTNNTDRNANHILVRDGQIYPIDHGNAFTGPGWFVESLRNEAGNVTPDWVLKQLVDPSWAREYAARIQELDLKTFRQLLGEVVPPEWASAVDLDAMVDFLTVRRPLIGKALGITF